MDKELAIPSRIKSLSDNDLIMMSGDTDLPELDAQIKSELIVRAIVFLQTQERVN
jgi:hypothetical protein